MPVSGERIALDAFLVGSLLAGGNAVGVRFSNRELSPLWGAGLRFGLAAALLAVLMAALRLTPPKEGTYGRRPLRRSDLCGRLRTRVLRPRRGARRPRTDAARDRPAGNAPTGGVPAPGAASHRRDLRSPARAGRNRRALPRAASRGRPAPLAACTPRECAARRAGGHRRPQLSRCPSRDDGRGRDENCRPPARRRLTPCRRADRASRPSFDVGRARLPRRCRVVVVFSLYIVVLRYWSASRVAYTFVLVPVVTVVLSAWLDDAPIRTGLLLGGSLVIAGVYVGALRPGRA